MNPASDNRGAAAALTSDNRGAAAALTSDKDDAPPDAVDEAAARAARRRPASFRAPGPAPLGAQGRPELAPGPEEDLSYLTGDFRIFQRRRGHRWSLDDLLTAVVALEEAERHGAVTRALDLGCGIGSVLMMVAWGLPAAQVTGIEAQEVSLGLLGRSLAYNGLAPRCSVLAGDLREVVAAGRVPAGGYDLVTGTPPYIPLGRGVVSSKVQRGPCCFELRGGVENYLEAGARALAPAGRLVLCAGVDAPEHPERVLAAAPALGLQVTRRLEVEPRAGKPLLLRVYALMHAAAAPGTALISERFLVREADGTPSPQLQAARARLGMPPAGGA